jgi:hypothetical protein
MHSHAFLKAISALSDFPRVLLLSLLALNSAKSQGIESQASAILSGPGKNVVWFSPVGHEFCDLWNIRVWKSP